MRLSNIQVAPTRLAVRAIPEGGDDAGPDAEGKGRAVPAEERVAHRPLEALH